MTSERSLNNPFIPPDLDGISIEASIVAPVAPHYFGLRLGDELRCKVLKVADVTALSIWKGRAQVGQLGGEGVEMLLDLLTKGLRLEIVVSKIDSFRVFVRVKPKMDHEPKPGAGQLKRPKR